MPEFKFSSHLYCGYSTRVAGNMSLCYGDTRFSLENRSNFLDPLGIEHCNLICAKQVHGSRVQLVQEIDQGRGACTYGSAVPDTDAFITDRADLSIAIFTADCLSIFLYDPIVNAIGLVHAGWRSTREQIVIKAIQLMQAAFGTDPGSLYVGLGPAIRNCCYEVEGHFQEYFSDALSFRDGRYYLDLIAANKKQLARCQVRAAQITDSGICTSCQNAHFYSYRKEGANCGRIISLMMLRQ